MGVARLVDKFRGELSKEDLDRIPRGFDTVGGIAILEVRKGTPVPLQRRFAHELLGANKALVSVYKKRGGHEGTYRTQDLVWLAGRRSTETIHKENNCSLLLDAKTCYFSPRLGTERMRIAKLVKDGENLLVMFSGVGVYPVIIAKNSHAARIVGVEINPSAHEYALKNITKNKVADRVRCFKGDVRRMLPKITGKFDRVLMPLPRGGESFLDIALMKVKKNGYLHFYDFLHEDRFDDGAKKVQHACALKKRKCIILGVTKCGQQSPNVFRICVDAQVR